MKLYRGNIGDFTGGIFASWFVTGVNGMDRPRSRPRRHSECAEGFSGEGAPSCLARPPFTQ